MPYDSTFAETCYTRLVIMFLGAFLVEQPEALSDVKSALGVIEDEDLTILKAKLNSFRLKYEPGLFDFKEIINHLVSFYDDFVVGMAHNGDDGDSLMKHRYANLRHALVTYSNIVYGTSLGGKRA